MCPHTSVGTWDHQLESGEVQSYNLAVTCYLLVALSPAVSGAAFTAPRTNPSSMCLFPDHWPSTRPATAFAANAAPCNKLGRLYSKNLQEMMPVQQSEVTAQQKIVPVCARICCHMLPVQQGAVSCDRLWCPWCRAAALPQSLCGNISCLSQDIVPVKQKRLPCNRI